MAGGPLPRSAERVAAIKSQGAEIQRARLSAGLFQRHAAEHLSVDLSTYRSWEHGRRVCPVVTRQRIAEEWGGDPKLLCAEKGKCPCCGREY